MVSEEFSFPKITSNPLPHFASSSSPSLWRVSSVVYPADFCDQLDDYIDDDRSEVATAEFKSLENNDIKEGLSYKSKSKSKGKMTTMFTSTDDQQEKMDLLWEDFNEELQRVSSFANNKQLSATTCSDCHEEDLQLCCVQPFNNISSKPAAVLYQPKKQSLVLVVKVLKKIFLLHKSAQIKKN